MHQKNKKFLKLPTYPGGSAALKEFIGKNLRYPDEALKNKIQGKVYVKYNVDDNGKVTDVEIINGLGYGCDEEALRLVNMLVYNKVKNIGQRVKSTIKITINFNLPQAESPPQVVNYSYVSSKKDSTENTYSYTININKPKENEQ